MKHTLLPLLLAAAFSAQHGHAQKPTSVPGPVDDLRQVEAVRTRPPVLRGAAVPLAVIDGKPADEAAARPAIKKEKGPTEIVALEATFDQKTNMAVFIGEVEVKDPEFNVKCDKLTAHLKSAQKPQTPPEAPDSGPARPAPPNAGAVPAKKAGGGGLQKAVAEATAGSRVLITQDKKDADGTLQHSAGEADRVTYDAVTGDIVLIGKPEIQQGINRVIATDPRTVMTLNRDGHMNAKGPTKTIIVDKAGGSL